MAKFRFPRRLPADRLSAEELTNFIELAYRLVLKRDPDRDGRAAYLSRLKNGTLGPAGLLADMKASAEYRQLHGGFDLYQTEEFIWYGQQRDRFLEADLRRGDELPASAFQEVWSAVFAGNRELVIGQRDYAPLHRRRFAELFSAVARLLEEHGRPRLLEFGVSEFSGFYKRLWPDLILELADRPTGPDYRGFNRERSLALSAAGAYHEIDLERPASIRLDNRYDVIVLAEVLEHLVVNPVELLGVLLGLLSPAGALYLTTPNFFRAENQQRWARRQNPQQVFPPGDDNWDAHHHHREYGARELLSFIREAGGRARSFHFSGCWDEGDSGDRPESHLSNLVFVITAQCYAAVRRDL